MKLLGIILADALRQLASEVELKARGAATDGARPRVDGPVLEGTYRRISATRGESGTEGEKGTTHPAPRVRSGASRIELRPRFGT